MVIEGNLKKIRAMENKILNGGYSNIDVEMEITRNFPEDLSGHNKSSLQSWQRILRDPNNQSSIDVLNHSSHLAKRSSTVSIPLDSPTHKKQVIGRDSISLSQSFIGTSPT